jgi:hypothetical protein
MSFWDFFVLLLIYVPLMLIWGTALVDVFRRDDLRGASKALWVLVIVFLPLIGTLVYLLSRPAGATALERQVLDEQARAFVQRHSPVDHAQQLEVLASLHDRGKLTDAEFAAEK